MKNAEKPMSNASRSKPDNPAQYKRFLEAAREAKAEETKEGADWAFNKVVRSKKPHLKST